jgi:hypothetical protein
LAASPRKKARRWRRWKAADIRRGPGRPGHLTAELADALVGQVAAGATLGAAARACGIGPRTLRAWRRRAWSQRAADRDYVQLERRILATLARARPVEPAAMEWQELAAVLEREHPARWGPVEPELDDLLGELQ